jgi:hypothetical protein
MGCALPFKEIMMPRAAKQDGLDKFRRLRANRRTQGMKLLRIWVPDPKAPGFAAEVRRQAALLRGAPEEQEALDFIEAAMDTDGWA